MRRKFLIMLTFFLSSVSILSAQSVETMHIRTVVIDAGHGGKDPGAIGRKSKEKDIVLAVARKLGTKLKAKYPSLKVIYTRDADYFVELYKRAAIANKNHADLFISIHVNSSKQSVPHGAETYVMGNDKTGANMNVAKMENSVILKEDNYLDQYDGFNPNDPEAHIIFSLYTNANLSQSLLFAQAVQDNFAGKLKRVDRGVKQAGFLVLWKTTMPSVLIELGFISNADEENYLISEKGQNELAASICASFVNFKNQYEGNAPENIDVHFVADVDDKPTDTVLDKPVAQPEDKPAVAVAQSADNQGVVYRVQIRTSAKRIALKPENFGSYGDLWEYEHGGVYKYTTGCKRLYKDILPLFRKARKDYGDCFIVAFKNGERIPLNQARSETNE